MNFNLWNIQKGESFSSCTRHEATGDISLRLCMPQNKSCHVVKHGYSYRVLGKSFNDLSCLQNSLPTWLSPSFALRQCCQLAVVNGMWKKMTGSFNYLSCSVISDYKYKIRREMINNKKLRWCAPFSVCCSSDRHVRPSACPVQLVCRIRISLRHSADRHVRPSACPVQSVCCFSLRRFSDRYKCPSACPVRSVCRISLRCSSDRHVRPSACFIRSVCRISLRCFFDWRSRYLHVLAADLRLFSFSRDFDTAFALP